MNHNFPIRHFYFYLRLKPAHGLAEIDIYEPVNGHLACFFELSRPIKQGKKVILRSCFMDPQAPYVVKMPTITKSTFLRLTKGKRSPKS